MKRPQEYDETCNSLKNEVYQAIVDLMKEQGVDKVDLSKNDEGETYKDEGWYNGECPYLMNISDERRYYIVGVELANNSLYFTIWDDEERESFEDPQFDRTYIQLADLVSIYWSLYEQLGLFENEE